MRNIRPVSYLTQNELATSFVDEFNAFLLALCPLLQHYKGAFMELSSDILLLMLPYTLLKLLAQTQRKLYVKPIIPFVFYAVYISVVHGLQIRTFAREAVLLVYFAAILNGSINIKKVFRAAKNIAMLNVILIVLQYFCYYILGFHLQFVPTDRLLESAGQWVKLAQTGIISVTGARMSFYRPSALFLEPSHLSIYCIPLLTILLLSNNPGKRQIRQAILISFAILLSTSGLGIGFMAVCWCLYGTLYYGVDERIRKVNLKDLLRTRSVIFIIVFAAAIVVAYFSISVFRASVNRVLFGNAINARTGTGLRLLGWLSGFSLLIGRGTSLSLRAWNISGFFYTMYQYGIIGCVLTYFLYVTSMFKKRLRREYRLLPLFIIVLSFFTVHTYAAYYRLYLISFVLFGYRIMYVERWVADEVAKSN